MKKRNVLKELLFSLAATVVLTSCLPNIEKTNQSESFTFVQICDPQLGFTNYTHEVAAFQQAVKQINALNPDFAVICGDLVHTANESSFADFNALKNGFRMPCYCVPGNHDVGNQPTAESLEYYRNVIGNDYFSFEHKGAWFIFVNTSLWKLSLQGESEKQDVWFRETLKAASEKGGPIFVVGHHPLFHKKPDEPNAYENLPIEKRRELLDLFEHYKVAAVVTGHTHRLVVNNDKGIQWVSAEAVSKNGDQCPLGFRVWSVQKNTPPQHHFVPLQEFE